MRNTGTGYVNFTTIESALAAREDYTSRRANEVLLHTAHTIPFTTPHPPHPTTPPTHPTPPRHPPPPRSQVLPCGPGEGEDVLNINFTSAQQNCRGGGKGVGGKGGGGGGGPMGGMQAGGMVAGAHMQGGKGGMGKGGGKGGPTTGGRSIYCGNLPREITPGVLASVSLGFGLLESLRFMPQQVSYTQRNESPNPNRNPTLALTRALTLTPTRSLTLLRPTAFSTSCTNRTR
jgi:hypothetical protein